MFPIYMTSFMDDIGANGVGGSVSGIANFVAPVAGRVGRVWFSSVGDPGTDTTFRLYSQRVGTSAAAVGTFTDPGAVGVPGSFTVDPSEPVNFMYAGDGFSILSAGEPGATGLTTVVVEFLPG
jgi:hypothetical protein